MKRNVKTANHELAYLAAYVVYIFYEVLSYSRYVSILPNMVFITMKLTIVGLLLLSVFLFKTMSFKELVVDFILFTLGIAVAVQSTKGFSLLIIVLFIMCSSHIDYWRLLYVTMIVLFLGWLFVTGSSLIGILENRTYARPALGLTAQTYGFNYYAYPTMALFTCSVIYLIYHRQRCSYLRLIAVFLLNYFAAQVYTTRVYLWALTAFELYLILTCKWKFIKLKSRIWDFIARWGYLACFAGTYIVYSNYDKSRPFWAAANAFLSGRLQLGKQGLDNYQLSLFGTEVIMSGNAERVYGNVSTESDYIDSGYLYTLLAYGIVFSLIIILCYTLVFRYLYLKQEILLYGWMGLFMILNIVNNYVLLIEINPMLLFTLTAWKEKANIRKKVPRVRRNI